MGQSLFTKPMLRSSLCAATHNDMNKRNLVNQRNFRSRRKQYVAELEQKLQQYEREGVAAPRRVQHAARLVLAENAVLRHLIQSEFGLDSQALDDQIFREMRNRVDL